MRSVLAAVGLLTACLLVLGCTEPGVRATGRAQIRWLGGPDASWKGGRCEYRVTTRWSSSLQHILRLEDASGEHAIVIQAASSFRDGLTSFPDEGRRTGAQGLAFDGATVRGALHGTANVSRSGDTTVVVLIGERRHRDTVPFEAECRMTNAPH